MMVVFYRRMPRFEYLRPGSLEEALSFLADTGQGGCRVYAGGTDLMPKLKKRLLDVPRAVVDLKGIPGLDQISYSDDGGLRIGALATISQVAASEVVAAKYPALAQGAANIASTHIQNRGTIVGNICSALPSADSAPALLALNASVNCVSPDGSRQVPLAEFFTGPSATSLAPGELVSEILVPPAPAGQTGVYFKLSPRARMDLAVVGVAVVGTPAGGRARDVRIALGAVAPTPVRASEAEAALAGKDLTDQTRREAAADAAAQAKPIDDHRASADYRRLMVEVLVRRGLEALAA